MRSIRTCPQDSEETEHVGRSLIPNPAMPLQPGTRLGPYEMTAQIGVGGMGEVYQATDTTLNRHVAIKVPCRYRKKTDTIEASRR